MVALSYSSSFATDLWFNRSLGFKNWALEVLKDTTGIQLGRSAAKDEDIVVVESEEDINGESVQISMARESRLHSFRAWMAGLAFSMGVVGLWGDRR